MVDISFSGEWPREWLWPVQCLVCARFCVPGSRSAPRHASADAVGLLGVHSLQVVLIGRNLDKEGLKQRFEQCALLPDAV